MRISDWSSDVCSSDLRRSAPGRQARARAGRRIGSSTRCAAEWRALSPMGLVRPPRSEERRVGKECVSRVDLGGRRIIKKKKKINKSLRRTDTNIKDTHIH